MLTYLFDKSIEKKKKKLVTKNLHQHCKAIIDRCRMNKIR